MFCPYCGSNQPDTSKFCSICGKKIGADNQNNTQNQQNANGENMQRVYNPQPNSGYSQPNSGYGQPNAQQSYGQSNTGYGQPNTMYGSTDTMGKEPSFFGYYGNAIKNYVNFSDRVSRKGYWMFILCNIIIYFCVSLLDGFINGLMFGYYKTSILSTIYYIFIFLPSIAIIVRRLHDIDKSGWWYLIALIPIIGWIWLIVLLAAQGTDGVNRFGDKRW